MIDLHSHVLPTLDHGARDWEEALGMCRIAVADGITVMAATPHVSDVFPNSTEDILAGVDELRRRLADADIPLEIVAGGDYHIDPSLGPDDILTLNNNGRYFLLEFPYQVMPPNSDIFVGGLVKKGITPIVTHPERIFTLHGSEDRLAALVDKGALVQVTAGSLTGDFGPACLRSAVRMLKKGWVHIIATDAHWVDDRPPLLSPGRRAAVRFVGEEGARRLVIDNPRAIIEGRDLEQMGVRP
jgi:protein-tyrosine phosphatase